MMRSETLWDPMRVGDAEGSCEGTADVGRIVRMQWLEESVL